MIRKVREPSSGVRVTKLKGYLSVVRTGFFAWGRRLFWNGRQMVQNRQCVNHTLLRGSGHDPPEKIAALRLILVGFGI